MTSFIHSHREQYGVEPICNVLPIAPSTYYEGKARETDHRRLPARARRDGELREQIRRGVHQSGATPFPNRKMPWCAPTTHCFRAKKRTPPRMVAP